MPTINDVAKRAGVSPVTVSRVINNAGNVSPVTRVKVEQAIQELGYVPSVAARSLRLKRTRTLALILPDITNTFWTTVARGVEDTAQRRDHSVFLCNTDEDELKQRRYLDFVVGQRVDGVIIAPHDADARYLAQLRDRDIPTVVIDRRIEGWEVDSVLGDSLSGAMAMVQHLIGLGHKRIAMLSGPAGASTAEDRIAGYSIALAEAGISSEPDLIRRGEFRMASGEEMTHRLFDEGLHPTAIFAANNAIAMGVIDALEQRELRIPQDVALVAFDDFPNVSHLFPFLTVVTQPAYDMGVNAAQLLLSRLDSEVNLQPRQVVLPTRLIIRHSCGSRLDDQGGCVLSLPLGKDARRERSSMVKPLSPEDRRVFSTLSVGFTGRVPRGNKRSSGWDKSDINRLLRVLQHQEADRLPHLELCVTSKSVYEFVLEHELKYDIVDAQVGGPSIRPEDAVEFALRLGMDAVVCGFSWRPNNVFRPADNGNAPIVNGSVKSWADLADLERPPSLAAQLGHLERYMRAAQGTGVGVIANFTSFFDSAMLAVGLTDAVQMLQENRSFLEGLMDAILEHQEKVMRAVCDRFSDDLALVMINDDVAHNAGPMIHPDAFIEIFPHRMQRLIAPAKEHGKLMLMHTDGKLDQVLPILYEIGFDAVNPIQPESNDIFELREQWAGRLAFVGNIPTTLLAYGTKEEIEEKVKEYCVKLAPGGGYVLSSSTSITQGIPPENFVAMTEAVHKYGLYGSLGREV